MPSPSSLVTDCLLTADALRFDRRGEPVFEHVSLRLEAGRLVLILGPNGSGKTTLLRCLAGVIRPIAGELVSTQRRAFLGHRTGLKTALSCRENLDFVRRFHGHGQCSADQALARVGLAGFGLRLASTLSAGQTRRLGLASLLVSRRPIWLLDEPYASLDDAGGALVDELISEHLESGGALALSTHQRLPEVGTEPVRLALGPAAQEQHGP
jgi:heme exporter protein A